VEACCAGTVINIDHHVTNKKFGDINHIDVNAAAVGEMIYALARELGCEISLEIAENIYCALMTDTGSFRYSNTSPSAFRLAGDLVELGVDPWKMSSNLYENQPVERMYMLSRVLQTLEVSTCGRFAILMLTRKMLRSIPISSDYVDGFINYTRSIRGVEIGIMIRALSKRRYKVSFRSRGNISVAELGERFGGGGHHNAAGCRIDGKLSDVIQKVKQTVTTWLDTNTI